MIFWRSKGELLESAAREGNEKRVNNLIDKSKNKISSSNFGWALIWAADEGHKEIVVSLLEKTDAKISIDDFCFALTKSADNCHLGITNILLDKVQDTFSNDDFGKIFISVAYTGQKILLDTLIGRALDKVSSKDFGIALYSAALLNHTKMIHTLVYSAGHRISYLDFKNALSVTTDSEISNILNKVVTKIDTVLQKDSLEVKFEKKTSLVIENISSIFVNHKKQTSKKYIEDINRYVKNASREQKKILFFALNSKQGFKDNTSNCGIDRNIARKINMLVVFEGDILNVENKNDLFCRLY